jgi:HAD superfamily hydrolase (TIGR01509 family)
LCVIFDLDGTLVETEQVWCDVRKAFVMAHGGRWFDGAQSTMIGMRTTEWANYIHNDLGVQMPPDDIARIVTANVINKLQPVPVMPGAQRALQRLGSTFRLALATSAALPVAKTVLERTGWSALFQVVVSADEVSRGKPAPDVYIRTLELMGCGRTRTAAIEDSTNGIRSAHAAELAVVAIPNREFPPDSETLALASAVIPDLDALTVALVCELLAT